jgi:hypothetical protein
MRKSVILGFTLVIALSFSMMIGMPVMAGLDRHYRCGRQHHHKWGYLERNS